MQSRTVQCRSFASGKVLDNAVCPCRKPAPSRPCSCDLQKCVQKQCDKTPKKIKKGWKRMYQEAKAEEILPSRCAEDFEELGCLPLAAGDVRGSDGSKLYDVTCLEWKKDEPCRGGLPFYRMHSDAMSPGMCVEFCVGKGLDIAGITDMKECRCGASRLNKASWHMGQPPPYLTLPKLPGSLPESKCHLHIYRYTGQFEAGAIPLSVAVNILEHDLVYIDSIATGTKLVDESIEDGIPSKNLIQMPPRNFPGTKSFLQAFKPGWDRKCWPSNCGPGMGLFPRRSSTPPSGVRGNFNEYVTVTYRWDKGADNARKEAVRLAAEKWRQATCINFVEGGGDADIKIGLYDSGSCYVMGLGYRRGYTNTVNLGWCNSVRYIGSVIHELGHVLGLNHEQKRPDAQQQYNGKGPHLKMFWQNVGGGWKSQYLPDMDTYTGSSGNYANYDFGSIMHYPGGSAFDTIPASAEKLTGNRRSLTKSDIAQVNDMYACKSGGGGPGPGPRPSPPGKRPPAPSPPRRRSSPSPSPGGGERRRRRNRAGKGNPPSPSPGPPPSPTPGGSTRRRKGKSKPGPAPPSAPSPTPGGSPPGRRRGRRGGKGANEGF